VHTSIHGAERVENQEIGILARGLLIALDVLWDCIPRAFTQNIRLTPNTMTSRYLTKVRALAAAAIAIAVIPLAMPAHGQDEETPPEVAAVEEAADEAAEPDAGSAEEYQALVEGYNPVDDDGNTVDLSPAFDFFTTSMLWTCIAAAMVFLMHLGFATLEAGLTQRKNTVNILFKNVFIISIGLLTYAAIGFNTHYPGGADEWNGWVSLGAPIGDLNDADGKTWAYGGLGLAMTGFGDFIFQAMFAATAATIVSGAVAERIKLPAFMLFATILVAIGYPIAGSWHWGEGVLNRLDTAFYDFAGSTVVHGFGGAAALACVIILGPRAGKYTPQGVKPILGHSMPLATIGVLLLWFGWFGFNGGSVLSADPGPLGLVFTTTALAAAAGAISSMVVSWGVLRKPDLSMALNGVLAGLVSITAGADAVGPWAAVLMGAIGGAIVVFSILFLDKIKIDDPVGAISVHGTVGIWGTLAVGIFAPDSASIVSQFIGVVLVYVFAFVFSFVVFYVIKGIMGVRVSPEEEHEGLDIGEHGQPAYHGEASA
jgi:Amt family ammonium transporter